MKFLIFSFVSSVFCNYLLLNQALNTFLMRILVSVAFNALILWAIAYLLPFDSTTGT